MLKVGFQFGDRTSQITEVSEDFFTAYQAIVDKEKRINRKETRRHQSLDKSMEHGFDVPDLRVNVLETVIRREEKIRIRNAIKLLTDSSVQF